MNARETDIGDDAELILFCTSLVAGFAELHALNASDPWAPDRGPLHARYEAVLAAEAKAIARIKELPAPTTLAGARAVARAALTQAELDHEGNPIIAHVGDALAYAAVEFLAGRATA